MPQESHKSKISCDLTGSSPAKSSREDVQAKQSGHHDLFTVAQIVGPDDVGPQVKNEMVRHRVETLCFDAHAVVYLTRPPHAVRLQGIISMWHP